LITGNCEPVQIGTSSQCALDCRRAGCQIVAVTYQNKELYGILLGPTATTLVTIAPDSKHVGAEMGFFALLHTSGSNLLHHPELHVLELLQKLQSGDTDLRIQEVELNTGPSGQLAWLCSGEK
jgi:hypothetical protein